MSDETSNVETGATEEQPQADASAPEGAILEELTRFGNRLAAVARQAWESDQRKNIETEVREGLLKAGERLDQVAEELRKSEVTQDLKVQASKTAQKVEESEVTQEIRKGVLTGLRRLNDELSDLLKKTEATEAPPAESESAAPPPAE